ncbi:MAG: hypothetical protein IPP74_07295 [Alphaproteobacteria bacterium]|nr:hypothetical protein [Alphaproteobacteria bacterium]
MKKSRVRCWKIIDWQNNSPHELLITYPEDNYGHDLISCLQCGHVYAVSVAHMVYRGPSLEEKLKEIECITCKAKLGESTAPYPEFYFKNGQVFKYIKLIRIPENESSILLELDQIYEY